MNIKCSEPGCNVKYIVNDHIFSPHLCELCNNYFCGNCMYLTCEICHLSYSCFWCGFNNKKCIQKCRKHINTTIEKCEEIDCVCKAGF